jgi:hypothetical protein
MLGRFRMTVHDVLVEYENIGRNIFGRPRLTVGISMQNSLLGRTTKYSAKALEKAFKDFSDRRSERSESGSMNAVFGSNSRVQHLPSKT